MTKFNSRVLLILLAGVFCACSAIAQNASSGKLPEAPAAKAQSAPANSTAPFKDQKEKASYALGMNVGTGLHRQSVDIDPDVFAQGLKDALSGGKTLLTDDEA